MHLVHFWARKCFSSAHKYYICYLLATDLKIHTKLYTMLFSVYEKIKLNVRKNTSGSDDEFSLREATKILLSGQDLFTRGCCSSGRTSLSCSSPLVKAILL